MHRREFLGTAAGAYLLGVVRQTLGAPGQELAEESPPPAPRLDAHVHVTSPELTGRIQSIMGEDGFEDGNADDLIQRMDASGNCPRLGLVVSVHDGE